MDELNRMASDFASDFSTESGFNKSDFGKPSKKSRPAPDYSQWLAIGRKLAEKHSGYQWRVGDWIVQGDDLFNVSGAIPGYLLLHKTTKDDGTKGFKSEKLPNFWEDVEAEIGLARSTVKQYAQVSRAYPKKKDRVKGLGWSHHAVVCTYARRQEYLRKCLDVPEGQKPHSISWLCRLVAKEEGDTETMNRGQNFVRIPVNDETYKMLKDLAKYYGCDVAEVASVPFKAVLEVFLEEQKKKVWLDFYGVYEEKRHGTRWPFDAFQTRRQRTQFWGNRRKRPMQRDTAFSQAQKARALASWEKRRARRSTLQFTTHAKLGRVS